MSPKWPPGALQIALGGGSGGGPGRKTNSILLYMLNRGALQKNLEAVFSLRDPPRAILASILGSLEGPQGPLVGVV